MPVEAPLDGENVSELQMLTEKACSLSLSAADGERLSALLLNSPEAQSFYLSYLNMHARLCWEFGAVAGPQLNPMELDKSNTPEMALEIPALLAAETSVQTAKLRQAKAGQAKSVRASAKIPARSARSVRTGQSRAWYRKWVYGGVAASVLVAILAGVWLFSGNAPVVLTNFKILKIEGVVEVERDGAKTAVDTSTVIRPGERIFTGLHSSMKLQSSQLATTVTVNELSNMLLPASDGNVFRLESGALDALVSKRQSGSEVFFKTPESFTKVIGTDFRLVASNSRTHLLMKEGRVEFTGAKESAPMSVGAREMAIASPDRKTVVSAIPANAAGTGLKADYFVGTSFGGTGFSRVDPNVNFIWTPELLPPITELKNGYSIRWTGYIEARFSETYTFELNADDDGKLWIDDQFLIKSRYSHNHSHDRGTVTLIAGHKHSIKLEFFQLHKGAYTKLYWFSDSQPREIVPQCQLFPTMNK